MAAVVSSVVVAAFGAPSASALTTTLNFDEFTTSTFIPTNQYATSGVLFERIGGGNPFVFASSDPSVLDDPNGSAFSTPSMLCGNNPANVGLTATFVDPLTQAPTTVDSVTVNVSSGPGPDLLSSNVVLTAYDADGNVLATDPANTSLQFDTLSVSVPGIASVTMPAGPDLDCYDDFTFGTPGLPMPTSKGDCKNGGWKNFGDAEGNPFKNQGQCIAFVNRNN